MITHLDRADQLAYRLQVARCVPAIESGLADSVVAHRFGFTDGAWSSLGVLHGWRRRKAALLPRFEQRAELWLATVDVKSYYPTLSPETLARVLNSLGIATDAVEGVLGFVDELHALPGTIKGVPIGPEASSVLGTVGLMSVDRVIRGTDHYRLVDDIWHVSTSEAGAVAWTDAVLGQFGRIGLEDNPTKRHVETGDDAIARITDTDIDYVTSTGIATVADGLAMLRSGIADQIVGRLRFGLKTIARHDSLLGVPIVLANRPLLDVEPHVVTRYLRRSMGRLLPAERDQLIAHVLTDSGEHAIAGRLRTAHALAGAPLDEGQADALMEAALLMTKRTHQPLRHHAIVAACRGAAPDQRLRSATELAEATDDLDLRRAVAQLNERRSSRRQAKSAVRFLARLDAELELLARPLLATL